MRADGRAQRGSAGRPFSADAAFGASERASRSVHLHAAWVVPVELGSGDWQSAAHALKDFADLLMNALNLVLVRSFSAVDGRDNVVGVGLGEWDALESLL